MPKKPFDKMLHEMQLANMSEPLFFQYEETAAGVNMPRHFIVYMYVVSNMNALKVFSSMCSQKTGTSFYKRPPQKKKK